MSLFAINRSLQWAALLKNHAEATAIVLIVVTETMLTVYRGGAGL